MKQAAAKKKVYSPVRSFVIIRFQNYNCRVAGDFIVPPERRDFLGPCVTVLGTSGAGRIKAERSRLSLQPSKGGYFHVRRQ